MSTKRVTGPYPLSCITCRERRKKCDRTHPTCNRCEAGGFTCLGYASRGTGPGDNPLEPAPRGQTVPSFGPNTAPHSGRNDIAEPTPAPPLSRFSLNTYDVRNVLSQTQTPFALHRQLQSPPWLRNLSFIGDHNSSGPRVNWACPNIPGPLHFSNGPTNRVEQSSDDDSPESNSLYRSTQPRHRANNSATRPRKGRQLDLTVYISPDTSAVAVEYITSQYEHAYSLMPHELVMPQENFVKSCVLVNIAVSKSACWSLFIGAKVFEAALSDYRTRFTKRYIKALDMFEQQIATVDRNGMLWEIRFLIDSRLAYRTLRLAVPIFLSMVDMEPTLWHRQIESPAPSLHSMLVSSGLSRFAIGDVTTSFLTGFPQFMPWDTTFLPELENIGWDEWMPACPVIFVLVLSRVNAWRHLDPCTRDPDGWRQCEKDIKEWRPSYYRVRDPSQSWRTIGRLGVQEALRHMTLIYLYMGMCGAKSGDHRVQESCKQISRLCRLVDANPNMTIHLYLPALVAGICAISEQHRIVIYRCLQVGEACRPFLFGTAGFAAAIEHLWHGVGSNGGQVTWDDYLESCQTVVRMKR